MSTAGIQLELAYLNRAQLHEHLRHAADRVMGIAGFGRKDNGIDDACPVIWLDLPVLGGETLFEVWTSNAPVSRGVTSDITWTCNPDALYGCMEITQMPGENLEASTYRAYCSIFDLIEQKSYSTLLRVWNYFPRINSDEQGVERYRRFNMGRHEAFIAKGRHIGSQTVPAACALGTHDGSLVIYFLASKRVGVALENPRQTSAYYYPEQFGPRSPTFSRAMQVGENGTQQMFISGTASIVGHESLHPGNIAAQTQETLMNIRVLLNQAENFDAQNTLFLKVYLRHPDYLAQVRQQVVAEFGSAHHAVYLQADVCRAELMLEIEGVSFTNQGVSEMRA